MWSTVQEPAASGIRYLYNTILSAAWSSSSTVVAVGFIQTANSGLILRSTTGGLSWTLLSVRKPVSFKCFFVFFVHSFIHLFFFLNLYTPCIHTLLFNPIVSLLLLLFNRVITYFFIFLSSLLTQVAGSRTSLVFNDVATYTTGMRMILLLVNR